MSLGTPASHSPASHSYDPAIDRHAAEAALSWYGWGSPVGLSIALIGLGVTALLIRFAWLGF
jgi:hypothetical protein